MHSLLAHHFREDAAEAPDVDGGGVGLGAEEDLGGAVPQRDDLVRVRPDGEGEGARQAEVCELDGAAVVDEQVLRLEVAVEDAMGVAVGDAGQQLMHVALRSGRWETIDITMGTVFCLACVRLFLSKRPKRKKGKEGRQSSNPSIVCLSVCLKSLMRES